MNFRFPAVADDPFKVGSVKVLGVNYDVVTAEGLATLDTRLNKLHGCVHYSKATIYVDRNQARDIKDMTLLHEVTHTIDNHLNIGLSEDQVNNIAIGMFQFLTENPDWRSTMDNDKPGSEDGDADE